MKFEIDIKEEVNQKQFNFNIKRDFEIESIVCYKEKIQISGKISEDQKETIISYYDSLITDFSQDTEYLKHFLKEKYILNAENGKDFVFENTAKLNILIQSGALTIEEAENYGEQVDKATNELLKGYFHSAYTKHVNVEVPNGLTVFHQEATDFIKNYINTKYPINFHI